MMILYPLFTRIIFPVFFKAPVRTFDYPAYKQLDNVGDKSEDYQELRRIADEYMQEHFNEEVQKIEKQSFAPRSDVGYDIHNCPEVPPPGYPFAWKTVDLLSDWPAEETRAPPSIRQSICVFDYEKDYAKAERYRDAALPFVVINDPAVLATTARWSRPGYKEELLGPRPQYVEISPNNHFMYVGPSKYKPLGWSRPTTKADKTYREWKEHAYVADSESTPEDEHWYFRLIACGDGGCEPGPHAPEYLFDELPFFQPKPSLYMLDPSEQKGIHCRFGMRGVISENHFDGGRNSIVVLGGQRRYILSHPDQCRNMALFPMGHPSARHSAVDWCDPDLEDYPEFGHAYSNEVVLQAGEVLHLPSVWFHYIVSLGISHQCNSRSGWEDTYEKHMSDCGFPMTSQY